MASRQCAVCGKTFHPKRSDARTCSGKCRQRLSVSGVTLRNPNPDPVVIKAESPPGIQVGDGQREQQPSRDLRSVMEASTLRTALDGALSELASWKDKHRLVCQDNAELRARNARLRADAESAHALAGELAQAKGKIADLERDSSVSEFLAITESASRINSRGASRLTSAEKTALITELQQEVAELRRAVEAEHAARVAADDQHKAELTAMHKRMAALEKAYTVRRAGDTPDWVFRMQRPGRP